MPSRSKTENGSMQTIEGSDCTYIPFRKYGEGLVGFSVSPHSLPNSRARFAMVMLERWGPVTGAKDGEDTAGRARWKPETPDKTAKRACDIAESAFSEFERRGWLTEMPDTETTEEMARANAERN